MDLNKACTILFPFEGGDTITNIPGDAGGLTKYGISKAANPEVDVANLTAEQAQAIYAAKYWTPAGCDKVKDELKYILFDTAVNMGVGTAIKLLQQSAGANVDGILGADTIAKSNNVSGAAFLFYRECSDSQIVAHRVDQVKFLGGWTARNMSIYSMLLKGDLN
jgi:lysozyme family protein